MSTKPKVDISIFRQIYSRVANVRHTHVISTIRNTHILNQQRSTRVKKLICVSRIHYIAKTVQRSYPALVASFICMFHLFMKFRHLRNKYPNVYIRSNCLFFVITQPSLYVLIVYFLLCHESLNYSTGQ